MNPMTRAGLLWQILKWRMTWNRRQLHYLPPGIDNPKFMTALAAAGLIPDGAVVLSSGMAANARASVWFWAVAEAFRRTGHPRDLTHITVGAQGGRGRVPGTVEELGLLDGCLKRFIGGHVETVKSILRKADAGKIELHTMPQGIEALLVDAQARGRFDIATDTGLGTFLDPRVGAGSVVAPPTAESLVTVSGDKLRYRLPPIDIAYFIAPSADADGNIYMRDCCMHTEAYESALAARANGGKVLVSVAQIIDPGQAEIFLTADQVDAIAVHPLNEQTGSVPQRCHWEMFTEGAQVDMAEAMEKLRFINRVLGITPKRTAVDNALARLAASTFTTAVKRCANVVIGVGLPEEVCRLIFEAGLFDDVTFISETGVKGGLPAPGIFFGAGINPREIMTSAQVFKLCYDHLDVAILGMLEVDGQGNVNVSRRGEAAIDYVGPGGFPDFCAAAKTLIFVGAWMNGARMSIADAKLSIVRAGRHKFVKDVREITMSGPEALRLGKAVYYVTHVGVFRLTGRGMELVRIMPGIDLRRDILDACPMRIVLPENGVVPAVTAPVVTGRAFALTWGGPSHRTRIGAGEDG